MTKDIVTKHENIQAGYGRKHALGEELGELLYNAVRASIVHGAIYKEGEFIDKDAEAAWRRVGNRLVEIIGTPDKVTYTGDANDG